MNCNPSKEHGHVTFCHDCGYEECQCQQMDDEFHDLMAGQGMCNCAVCDREEQKRQDEAFQWESWDENLMYCESDYPTLDIIGE